MTTQIHQMLAQIADLGKTHPKYFGLLEDTDLDTADRAQLNLLMASAPTDQVAFFILGKYSMRVQLATLTGRAFL